MRGTATEQVLFRALGSDLGKSGIANSLANPVLEVRDNNGVLLASNDNWQDSRQSEEISSLGLTPGSETDAALLLTLVGGLHCSGQGCSREHRHCATGNQGATLIGSTRRLDARRMLPQIFGSFVASSCCCRASIPACCFFAAGGSACPTKLPRAEHPMVGRRSAEPGKDLRRRFGNGHFLDCASRLPERSP